METAAERLYDDYKNDTELTIFTQLDGEDFYDNRFGKLPLIEPASPSERRRIQKRVKEFHENPENFVPFKG